VSQTYDDSLTDLYCLDLPPPTFSPQASPILTHNTTMLYTSAIMMLLLLAGSVTTLRLIARHRREFVVSEGFAGLLYEDGRLTGSLIAGRHIRWGRRYDLKIIALHDSAAVPAQPATGQDPAGSLVNVLCPAHVFTVREAPAVLPGDHASAKDPLAKATLAGVPLRILMSERSGPGLLLRDTLLVRPSQERD